MARWKLHYSSRFLAWKRTEEGFFPSSLVNVTNIFQRNWRQRFPMMEYISNLPIDVEISYKLCLGGGSLLTVLKCKILGLMTAAKVFQVNYTDSTQKRKMQVCLISCSSEMSCNSEVLESRRASLSWFLSSWANNSCPLLSVALYAYMTKKKKQLSTAGSNIMLQIAVAMNYLHESGWCTVIWRQPMYL